MASQSPPLSNTNGINRKKASSPTKSQLPPGWERVKSDQGAYYYWDKKSGKTSWKFPEEEAKAHSAKLKKHSYENIQVQALAEKKRATAAHAKSKPDELSRSYVDEHHTYVNTQEHRTYMNICTAATTSPVDHTHNADLVPPPPPPAILQIKKDSGSSHYSEVVTPTTATPTPDPPMRTNRRESEKAKSPTPPIPDRGYSDEDVRMSPPPPLPERQYSCSELLESSPPPLPERHYTAADLMELKMSAASAVTRGQGPTQNDSTQSGETRDRSKSLDSDHLNGSMRYEVSELGHQYALVTKGKVVESTSKEDKDENAPPPLPKRFRERFSEGSPYNSTENISQAVGSGVRNRTSYVDIDHSDPTSGAFRTPYTDTIAYAVVKVDESSNQVHGGRRSVSRREKPPRPYEHAVSSGTPPPPSLAELKPKRPPAYEEIDTGNSPQMDADGYMKVNRTSSGGTVYVKTKSSDSPDQARPDMTKPAARASSQTEPEYQTPDVKGKVRGSVTTEEGGLKAQGEASSQDSESVFDSSLRYDLPSNSRRLNAMNVTLRRNPDADAAAPGYSKLDLSKEALLLRSGVTLRRLNHYSLSSVSSFFKEDGTPEEEGSEVGSGTTPDTMTDEEDILEPVSKCINSLRNSLGVDDDEADGDHLAQVPMAKAPTGPPRWTNFKRRPHAYEEVQGGSQDETKSGLASLCDSSYEVSKSMSDFDMAWDNSDLGMGLHGTNYSSTAGSSSQPNLLQDPQAQETKTDKLFPHLVKPNRVSEEAFQLRKNRLMHHKYEDVEEAPGASGAGGPVGDVNALTAAVRESWLEGGGDKNSPPGSGKSKLPQGWRKLKDDDGRAYYWHVPTGRTQYERPSGNEVKRLSLSVDESSSQSTSQSPPPPTSQKLKFLTFSARYLGYRDVMESMLIPGQCVEVVHSCVRDLAADVSEWPSSADQGKAVFLQVHNMELRWLNPADATSVTSVQPINRIRVWGIGLENERDFGYIARDSVTKKHKCHVFRCDVPARAVARALLESHQKGRKAKSPTKKEGSPEQITKTAAAAEGKRKRDSAEGSSGRSLSPENEMQENLPSSMSSSSRRTRVSTSPVSYSDMQGRREHYERIECSYIGSCEVPVGMGMEILNEAVDKLSSVSQGWLSVNVDVATSCIKISDSVTKRTLYEHKVRFLCFLGIARDDHFCGYILDGGERDGEKVYIFHGFRKEPNTDRLCLALHTACQARYKKVLEAHPELSAAGKDKKRSKESPDRTRSQSSSSSLFGRLGSLRKMKKQVDEDRFVVQYCGYLPVSRPDGLEMVKDAVQQLAVPKMTSSSAAPVHLVEFDISPSGISLTDPQKKFFGRKHFSSKIITYVLRIRNYFAFVAKESGKFYCHVFLETEVDAGTVVTTIQKLLAPDNAKQQRK